MLKIELTLEDSHLSAERDVDTKGKWSVKLLDMPTNTKVEVIWTDEEIAAVVALSLGSDNLFDTIPFNKEVEREGLVAALYEVAEPCFKDIAVECRLIP